MIVLGLLNLVGSLVNALPIQGPELDPSFFSNIDQGWEYIMNALNMLGAFIGPTGMQAIGIYLLFIVAINAVYFAWQIFNFIMKKIPFLNYTP